MHCVMRACRSKYCVVSTCACAYAFVYAGGHACIQAYARARAHAHTVQTFSKIRKAATKRRDSLYFLSLAHFFVSSLFQRDYDLVRADTHTSINGSDNLLGKRFVKAPRASTHARTNTHTHTHTHTHTQTRAHTDALAHTQHTHTPW